MDVEALAMEALSRRSIPVANLFGQYRQIASLAYLMRRHVRAGGRIFFAGNGGSAADAQHLAAEYIAGEIPALALTTDTSVITALANDMGFETIFKTQLAAHDAKQPDVLIVHSTSGDSENLVQAVEYGRHHGVTTVGVLSRRGGKLLKSVEHALLVPTPNTQIAQELHLIVGHILHELVSKQLIDESPEVLWHPV